MIQTSLTPIQFGIGNGAAKVFPLVASATDFSGTPRIFRNAVQAVPVTDYTFGADGNVTFVAAPGAGVVLTWSGAVAYTVTPAALALAHKTIIGQYQNSATLVRMIQDFAGYIDPSANFDQFIKMIWNIDTATAFGLDILGRILNVSRQIDVPAIWLSTVAAATNLFTYSGNFSQAAWPNGGASVTANAGIAPDGTVTAALFDDTGASAFPSVPARSFTATGNTMSVSVFTKTVAATYRSFLFYNITASLNMTEYSGALDYNTGIMYDGGGVVQSTRWVVEVYPGGWYRISITLTDLTPGSIYSFYYGRSSSAPVGDTSKWLLWGGQLETNPAATSYIPTTSAPVTRAAVVTTSAGILNLTDEPYRALLRAKALSNISDSSARGINAVLRALFAGRGNAFSENLGNMHMRYKFLFALQAFEYGIMTQSQAVPAPAGVKTEIFSVQPYFGFTEANSWSTFGESPFASY